MPIVGTGTLAVMAFDTGGATSSSTMANAPASASARASASNASRSASVFPLMW